MIRNLTLAGSRTRTRCPSWETCQPWGTPIENPVGSRYLVNPAGTTPGPLLPPGLAGLRLGDTGVPVLGCHAGLAWDAFGTARADARWPGTRADARLRAAATAARQPTAAKTHRRRRYLLRGKSAGGGVRSSGDSGA